MPNSLKFNKHFHYSRKYSKSRYFVGRKKVAWLRKSTRQFGRGENLERLRKLKIRITVKCLTKIKRLRTGKKIQISLECRQ